MTGVSFSGTNGLGTRVGQILRFLALRSIVSRNSTVEASPFSDAFGSFSRGKFGEGDSIDVHSIRVMSWSGGSGVEGRGDLFSFQDVDMHLLCMEHFGLFDSFVNGGRNSSHREDHSGYLLVKSKGKLVNEGDVVGDACFG